MGLVGLNLGLYWGLVRLDWGHQSQDLRLTSDLQNNDFVLPLYCVSVKYHLKIVLEVSTGRCLYDIFFLKFDKTMPNLVHLLAFFQELSTQPHCLHQLTEFAQVSDGC